MTIKEQQTHALRQELLTVEQFALLTQYSPKSIYRMIAKGYIAVVRLSPRTIRIPRGIVKTVRAQHPNADQLLSL